MGFLTCCRNINRKKYLDENLLTTELRRCLGIFDLTLLGISGMMGAGIYVLTGAVAKGVSGPAVPISYLLAAFAAFLSAICYAEFGARIPTTGSSYIFTYMTMGEIWGFLMGWNMILEHGVGSASVAKAWSGYLDSIFEYPMKNYLQEHVPMGDGSIVATYPDFLATGIILLLCGLVACGIQSSNKFNITFAFINIGVVLFIIITGFMLADIKNWTQVKGGFTPFGFAGVVAGASRCFYAFAGFDVVASSCEEARNPRRDIPIALAISLGVVTVAYVGISSVLTLMVPWFDILPKSAFPHAYAQHNGWQWAQLVVTFGALCTMTSAMFSGLFVLPRILYAISKDGLLCPILSSVNEKTQVPVYSVLFAALLSGLMAMLFDLETLVQFMSIGTLTAYSFVAACVIILRYTPPSHLHVVEETDVSEVESSNRFNGDTTKISSIDEIQQGSKASPPRDTAEIDEMELSPKNTPEKDVELPIGSSRSNAFSETTRLVFHRNIQDNEVKEGVKGLPELMPAEGPQNPDKGYLCREICGTLNTDNGVGTLKKRFQGSFVDRYLGQRQPGEVVLTSLLVAVVFSLAGMVLASQTGISLAAWTWWRIVLLINFSLVTAVSLLIICTFQQNVDNTDDKTFRVPFVPILPFLSICTNVFFMIKLQWITWLRLFIWVGVGLLIYFAYGYHYSQRNKNRTDPHWTELLQRKVGLACLGITSKKNGDLDRIVEEEDD